MLSATIINGETRLRAFLLEPEGTVEEIEKAKTVTTTVIPATPEQSALAECVNLILDGEWCRDYQYHPFSGRACALGLVNRVASRR